MTEQEQQEYAAEMLRMVERYKAGEAARRVPMVDASQMGAPDPTPFPYSPPAGTAASTGGPTDVFQPEAREYASRSLEALGRGYKAYQGMEADIDAAGPAIARRAAGLLRGSNFEYARQNYNEAQRRYQQGDTLGGAAYDVGTMGYAGLGAIDAAYFGSRGILPYAAKEIQHGLKAAGNAYRRIVPPRERGG